MRGTSVRMMADFMRVSESQARRWLRENGGGPRTTSPHVNEHRESARKGGVRKFKARKKAAGEVSCEVCGWAPPERAWSAMHGHHIVPVATGGSDEEGNLVLLCPNCHGLAHAVFEQRYGGDAAYFGPTARQAIVAALRAVRERT